jgi:hypothetical protein
VSPKPATPANDDDERIPDALADPVAAEDTPAELAQDEPTETPAPPVALPIDLNAITASGTTASTPIVLGTDTRTPAILVTVRQIVHPSFRRGAPVWVTGSETAALVATGALAPITN